LNSDDLLQKAEGEICANWHGTIRELHHIIPKVSKTAIHEAVTEKLGYRKLCTHWVPKMLTDDHKTKQIGLVLKFLMHYTHEGDEFLDSIVIGDEILVSHHTPKSKQQSLQWSLQFKGQAADFYDSGIQKLVPKLNKCLDNASDYVEK
jgi:hypothetical protein